MHESILIIEDEPALVLTISDLLIAEGYRVESASEGDEGLRRALEGKFELIILDVMLPKKTGLEVCQELRQRGVDVAILMLTAKTQVADRVTGLRIGADDYVTKPFDSAELKARMEALLRRAPREDGPTVKQGKFGNVRVDFARAEAQRGGEQVSLTGRELKLLQYLMEHQDRVVSREEVLKKVWEYEGEEPSRTVDVHIAWLRQKLDDPENPRYIQTVRGKGYRFAGDQRKEEGPAERMPESQATRKGAEDAEEKESKADGRRAWRAKGRAGSGSAGGQGRA